MRTYSEIFENNRKWAAGKLAGDAKFFDRLSKGQSPEYLYIGCCDSRVTAEQMMGAQPGDLFVHRNIANQVRIDDLNTLSVIRYAVETLKVGHIVVCGHTNCGGVQAAMSDQDMGKLEEWIGPIRKIYHDNKGEILPLGDSYAKYDRLVELNVLEQCKQILKIPEVKDLVGDPSRLKIHGWIYDMRTGELKDMDFNYQINR